MTKRNRYTEEEKKAIIDFCKGNGFKDCHRVYGIWPDTVKRWLDPDLDLKYKQRLSELYHNKYKHDDAYKDRIKKRGEVNYSKHINKLYSCAQMRQIIAETPDNALTKYNVTLDNWHRCKQYIERTGKYRETNKDKIYARTQTWFSENKDKVKEYNTEYIDSNRDKIRNRIKKRKKTSPVFKLSENIRNRIYQGLKGFIKTSKAEELLGCTFNEFKYYLESKFIEGMSWSNYGTGWHVDHIKPISLFNLIDPEEQRKAFNYTNCQPLFALDNLKKSNKYEHIS